MRCRRFKKEKIENKNLAVWLLFVGSAGLLDC